MITAPGADLEPYWADQGAHALTVKKTGRGDGVVKSRPAGIRCGSDCVEIYAAGTQVRLVAKPAPGSVFVRWSFPSRAADRVCLVDVSQAMTVRARFKTIADHASARPLPR